MSLSAGERIRDLEEKLLEEKRRHQETLNAGVEWQSYAKRLEAAESKAESTQFDPTKGEPKDGSTGEDLRSIVRGAVNEATAELRKEVSLSRQLATDAIRQHSSEKMDRTIMEMKERYKDDFADLPDGLVDDHVRVRVTTKMREHRGDAPLDLEGVLRSSFEDVAMKRKAKREELAKVNLERAEAAKKKASIPDLVEAAGLAEEWSPPKTHEESRALLDRLISTP